MVQTSVLAHAKWFVDWSMPFPTDWRFMAVPAAIAMVGGVGGLAAVWIVATRRAGIPDLPDHRLFAWLQPRLPRIAAASLGIVLFALAANNRFLAPHQPLDQPEGWVIALIEGLVGIWLIVGLRLRQAAAAVGVLALVGLAVEGPVAILEAAHMWGIAWFLWLAAATDRPAAGGGWQLGVPGLRLGVGVALVAGGLSEKLMNPALTRAVLDTHPAMNLPQMLGLGIDMATYIRFMGSAELLLGLLIIVGVTPRLVALATAAPFVATVPLFGFTELFGHLPFYGALLVLLTCGSTGQPLPTISLRRRAPAPRPHPQPATTADVGASTTAPEEVTACVKAGD
ncbi:MAG: hypothetical protein ACRDZ4_13525 [Egibacteraceae bacterium]